MLVAKWMDDVDRVATRKTNFFFLKLSDNLLHYSLLWDVNKSSTDAQTRVTMPMLSISEFKLQGRFLLGACVIWRMSLLIVVILPDGRTLFRGPKTLLTGKCASSWW